MLQISCPWCGVRDEAEFRFGGESHITRPEPQASDEQWSDYLFVRANIKGLSAERWCHKHGCNQWFNIVRNTVTHEILQVYHLGENKPEVGG